MKPERITFNAPLLIKTQPVDTSRIDAEKLKQRVAACTRSVTEWASTRLARARGEVMVIDELFSDYAAFCHDRKFSPLPRKVWLASMKMAGFQTQSGGLAGVKLLNPRKSITLDYGLQT